MLAKTKLNIKEVVFSKALIDSYISHDEVISVNNVIKEYGEMKEVIKNPESSKSHIIQIWLI